MNSTDVSEYFDIRIKNKISIVEYVISYLLVSGVGLNRLTSKKN